MYLYISKIIFFNAVFNYVLIKIIVCGWIGGISAENFIPTKEGRGTEVSYTLGSRVPFAYTAMCGIQREAKKKHM